MDPGLEKCSWNIHIIPKAIGKNKNNRLLIISNKGYRSMISKTKKI